MRSVPHTTCMHPYTFTNMYFPGKNKKAEIQKPSPKIFRVKKKNGKLVSLNQIWKNIKIC